MKHNDFAVGMIREQLLDMVSSTRLRVGERNTVFEAAEIIAQLVRERDEAREKATELLSQLMREQDGEEE